MTVSAETEDLAGADDHAARMDAIYRTQRHLYDLTRKYYLLGRDRLIADLDVPPDGSVLELGCGTGRNLELIAARYPQARLFGLDISAQMLASAGKKLRERQPVLRRGDASAFSAGDFNEAGFDRIVISYALSMIPPWEQTIEAAIAALNPGGSVHIVDFGQQEHLPGLFRAGLHGWLARFHVAPRAELFDVANYLAFEQGLSADCRPLFRGYAWSVTIR